MSEAEPLETTVQRILKSLADDNRLQQDLTDLKTLVLIVDDFHFPNNRALYGRDVIIGSFNLLKEMSALRQKIEAAITEIENHIKNKIKEELTEQIINTLLKQTNT